MEEQNIEKGKIIEMGKIIEKGKIIAWPFLEEQIDNGSIFSTPRLTG